MTTASQRQLGRAQLDLARRFGVGGASWTITRTTGDGVTADPTPVSGGTVTAYVRRFSLSRLVQALAQAPIGAAEWRIYAPLDQDIRVGDVLTSAADTSLVFSVTELSTDRGILVGLVDKPAV